MSSNRLLATFRFIALVLAPLWSAAASANDLGSAFRSDAATLRSLLQAHYAYPAPLLPELRRLQPSGR